MEELKVLITTSGIGSRLGILTDFTNKSLVRVGSKPIISHIIDSYPRGTSFVVTLGYYGEHVRQYLEMVHQSCNIAFVDVENYDGEGSSLLHSMSVAKNHLQSPFIFHACDTIAEGHVHSLKENWIASAVVENADQYRTLRLNSSLKFEGFNEKGEITFDFAYPGICGIKDYEIFWECLDRVLEENNRKRSLSDCDVINEMTKECSFETHELKKWYDIGNVSELEKTRKCFKEEFDVLDKPRESIYFYDKSVIKFFHDSETVKKRVERCSHLMGLTPKLEKSSDNFFKYEFVEGDLFSDVVNPTKMKKFLEWASSNMWSKRTDENISDECYSFYFEKTNKRIEKMLHGEPDKESVINGSKIPPVDHLIDMIDRDWLCDGLPGLMHGDMILDNVIEKEGEFVLIDWRQDFANRKDIGDIYYDLAKLNHNLTFNHELVNSNLYYLEDTKDGIKCDILCKKNLVDCKEVLVSFIKDQGYDFDKVDLLTAIVWINMSPLHEHPLDKFLFNFGKYNLYRALKKIGKI